MVIALDTNVLRQLEQEGSPLCAKILDWKRKREQIVIAPQVVLEVEQAGEGTADRLLDRVAQWCDGILGRDVQDIIRDELFRPSPYVQAQKTGLRSVKHFDIVKRKRDDPEIIAFREAQARGYQEAKKVLPEWMQALRDNPEVKIVPFHEYVEGRRIELLKLMVPLAVKLPPSSRLLPQSESDWERGWKKAPALRMWVLMVLGNEYLTALKPKGWSRETGCMTDLRIMMESAYVDIFVTSDGNLFMCCDLLAKAGLLLFPRIELCKS